MTARKPQPTPALDKLEGRECNHVLTELLALHPELAEDAEHIALALLMDIDADKVAESIEAELRAADLDQLASRAGRVRGRGYVHENEAAAEILEELLQPALDDLARRASLDLRNAAGRIGLGLLRGISRCRDAVEMGTVLAYAGPDVVDDLAQAVELVMANVNVRLPADPP
ncbi:MAG: hypothetical protein ACYDGN_01835 [Acidimicrobiales bacterium]